MLTVYICSLFVSKINVSHASALSSRFPSSKHLKTSFAPEQAQLLSAAFTTANAGALKRASTPWSRVPANATLDFASRGRGEVSVAASLNFVPFEILTFPTYRGLWVQRILQLREGGGGVGAAPLAASVTVVVQVRDWLDGWWRLILVVGIWGLVWSTEDAGSLPNLHPSITFYLPLIPPTPPRPQVTTPDDMQDVVVEVMMPGGLEPLDPKVYPDPDAATICTDAEEESDLTGGDDGGGGGPVMVAEGVRGGGFSGRPSISMGRPAASEARPPAPAPSSAVRRPLMVPGGARLRRRLSSVSSSFMRWPGIWPPWPVCPAQETTPATVKFSYSFMAAGTHTVKFKAIAATPGSFVLPPVKAFVAKQPELMGLSPGGKFTVCGARAESCNVAEQPAPAAPKRCPSDCSGNGACNLVTGNCLCDAGFGGPACSTFAVV